MKEKHEHKWKDVVCPCDWCIVARDESFHTVCETCDEEFDGEPEDRPTLKDTPV